MTGIEFKAWLRDHLARHRRLDWPTGDESIAFFNGWLKAFRDRAVTAAEATDASQWLSEAGGAFPDGHLGRMLARVEARRRGAAAESAGARRAAERAAVAAEVARERRLRARWRRLPRDERRAILADVKAENPALARWPLWILRIALERPSRLEAVGR